MASSKQIISTRHKEEYLELIITQKAAAFNRCQQQTSTFAVDSCDVENLFSRPNQQSCQPKKHQAKDAILMNDDDYLLAELNGHFQ